MKGHLLSQERGIQVLIVEARSAVVRLNWCESQDLDIDPMSVKYRLLINKGKDDGPNFTEVYRYWWEFCWLMLWWLRYFNNVDDDHADVDYYHYSYSGDAQEIALNDLTPATVYFVK